jgi:hypothetical protein
MSLGRARESVKVDGADMEREEPSGVLLPDFLTILVQRITMSVRAVLKAPDSDRAFAGGSC